MQIDFHHATTYVLSRLAGFSHPEARTIAYAAQYVDDATCSGTVYLEGRAPFDRVASAHPIDPRDAECPQDFMENANNVGNLASWSLFHFLPGNGGEIAGQGMDLAMVDRFVCTPDSPVANAMWTACREAKGTPHALYRLGITAHVYVDTWAHQGFVGMKHARNHAHDLDRPGFSVKELLDNLGSQAFREFPLGHAMGMTLPDMPFLTWSYVNYDGNKILRNNTLDFLAASQRLVEQMGYFRGEEAHLQEADRAALEHAFRTIQHTDGRQRHRGWLDLLAHNPFSFGILSPVELEELAYPDKGKGVGSWKEEALGTASLVNNPGPFTYTPAFETSHWKLFHEALKDHRNIVWGSIFRDFGLVPSVALEA